MLEAKRLTKRFDGVVAVDDLSITVRHGEAVGLQGPNGSGKTTLLDLLSGQLKPDGGEIYFRGQRVTGFRPSRLVHRGIARTFQIPRPIPRLTVSEQVMAARLHLGEPWSVVRGKAEAILQQTGLTSFAFVPTRWLSQGALRRLELARALATSPSVLLVDEPFASLSGADKTELVTLLEKVREQQTSIVLVAHNPGVFGTLVDRILVLHAGRIVDELPPVARR